MLLLFLLSLSSCYGQAIHWVTHNTSQGSYAEATECDFNYDDFTNVPFDGSTCANACFKNIYCSHYVLFSGICYLKFGTVAKQNAYSHAGRVCGLLLSSNHPPPPTHFTFTTHGTPETGIYSSANNCNFPQGTMGYLYLSADQCGVMCAQSNSCGSYTWAEGRCFMKRGTVTEKDAQFLPLNVCGITIAPAPHPPSPPLPVPPPVYKLAKGYYPDDFLNGDAWDYFTQPDPTWGYVKYIDRSSAVAAGILYKGSNGNQEYIYMGSSASKGPVNSVRVASHLSFTGGLVIYDALHIPTGCGTWPALWTVGPNWPIEGEIDIMEGVNGVGNNSMTLHSRPGCQMTEDNKVLECSAGDDGSMGCGVVAKVDGTFGPSFNNNPGGGGVYAMEWIPGDHGGLKIWIFPRDKIPANLLSDHPDPSTWPTAGFGHAKFPFGANCWGSTFNEHKIIINLTFCGQWAGAVFDSMCGKQVGGKSCTDYLTDNPAALKDAYFKLYSVKLFQAAYPGESITNNTGY